MTKFIHSSFFIFDVNRYIFQGVGMLFSGGFSSLKWEEDETRECRFVFIGRNLDRDELMAGVNACRVDDKPLRFKVGDDVLAKIGNDNDANGGWAPGKVIVLWDEGNPYRIRLSDGVEIWGPKDSDIFVRSASTSETKFDESELKKQKTEN